MILLLPVPVIGTLADDSIIIKIVYTEPSYKTTTKDIHIFLINLITRDFKPGGIQYKNFPPLKNEKLKKKKKLYCSDFVVRI